MTKTKKQIFGDFPIDFTGMGGSPGDVSENPMT